MSFRCLQFPPKNERKQVDLSRIVRFLEETSTWKNNFDFFWPLVSFNEKLVMTYEENRVKTKQELFGVYGVGSWSPDKTTNSSENANSEFSVILYSMIDEKTCSSWWKFGNYFLIRWTR